MKVLFISPGDRADYQCDMLFHGLRCLPGFTVTDVNPLRFMYKAGSQVASRLRGFGFSLYGLLEEDPAVHREEIRQRIRKHEFDLVVFGSIHRGSEYLSDVLGQYGPSEVAFVDGEDHQVVLHALLGCGVYFKRELPGYENASARVKEWVKPITFAIPEEKIVVESTEKTQTMAYIDPRRRSTYIYTNEVDYYADYRRSRFGVTMKKAGWIACGTTRFWRTIAFRTFWTCGCVRRERWCICRRTCCWR